VTAGGAPVAYRERLAVAEAVAAVLAEGAPPGAGPGAGPGAALGSEVVPLADAVGRVLARDVAAPADVPPWANASMDGYAVRAADVRGAAAARPVALRVAATAYAAAQGGDRGETAAVGPGLAVRIATGAPVPDGADAVVRVEDTRPDPADAARVLVVDDRDARDDAPGGARRNVRPAGEDVRAGGVAVATGTRVTPGVAGLLAAAGAARVAVARRPRVAIIASGDELVPLDRAAEAHAGRAVVSANSVTLAALVREAGGEPVDLGIAPDAEPAVRALFVRARALACDVVLTTGGVSVGERDHVRPAAAAADLHFWRVRLRPGGPLAFGTLPAGDGGRRVPWLGLPGNPVSTVVTFALFVRPLLAALQGDRRPYPAALPAVLAEPVRTAAALTHLLRATLEPGAGGRLVARLTGPQGSGLLSSVARADAYVVVPEPARALAAGAPVWVLPAGAWASAAEAWPPGLWDAPPADAPAPNAAGAPR
jgi:molybdopterin molybdotransferase